MRPELSLTLKQPVIELGTAVERNHRHATDLRNLQWNCISASFLSDQHGIADNARPLSTARGATIGYLNRMNSSFTEHLTDVYRNFASIVTYKNWVSIFVAMATLWWCRLERCVQCCFVEGNTHKRNFWNPEVQCQIHSFSPIIPTLTRINPIPRIDTFFFKIYSNTALPSTPRPS